MFMIIMKIVKAVVKVKLVIKRWVAKSKMFPMPFLLLMIISFRHRVCLHCRFVLNSPTLEQQSAIVIVMVKKKEQ